MAVPKLMADVNIEGHLAMLVDLCLRGYWAELWMESSVIIHAFREFGLSHDVLDSRLWQLCQDEGIVLVTGNRNQKGIDSLEQTIRSRATEMSLPVLTLSNPTRVVRDRLYAEQTADRLAEIVLDVERYRGMGRLFLP